MYSSKLALNYASQQFLALAKCINILPVILIGWLRGVHPLTRTQVIIAITITSGLLVFSLVQIAKLDDDIYGVGVVLICLLIDGIV